MPANSYQPKKLRLDAQINDKLLNAFVDAQVELQNASAPTTYYLELFYDGKIRRAWDGTQMDSVSGAELLRLYPQLDGLFKKAIYKISFP